MVTFNPNAESKFVILQGLKEGNRFFSMFSPGDEPRKLTDGTVAYRVLGYSATVDEAQVFLYGKSFVGRTMTQL